MASGAGPTETATAPPTEPSHRTTRSSPSRSTVTPVIPFSAVMAGAYRRPPAAPHCAPAVARRRRSDEVRESDVRIGQPGQVSRLRRHHDGLELVDDIPHVDVHGRSDDASVMPEGDELTALEVTTHNHGITGLAVADVFEAEVVLVGEEVRQAVIDVAGAGGVDPCRQALVESRGPMLNAQVALVVGMPGVGDVTGRVDALDARLQVAVDDDAIVDPEPQS